MRRVLVFILVLKYRYIIVDRFIDNLITRCSLTFPYCEAQASWCNAD